MLLQGQWWENAIVNACVFEYICHAEFIYDLLFLYMYAKVHVYLVIILENVF